MPRLSVNISATSLVDPLLSLRVREVLARSGMRLGDCSRWAWSAR
ncbi:MAG: hypothetical protein NTY67_15050 [Cyanobacteria bacterium]|nr:hypothetical protein [Cyanobacteriota bacterium]